MANGTVASEGPLVTADGRPLKQSLQAALAQRRRAAFLLTVPLLLFIFIFFVLPIVIMLWRSVDNPEVSSYLPNTVAALASWDEMAGDLPGEDGFAAMVKDLQVGRENRTIGKAARRLNYEIPGMSSLFRKSARKSLKITEGPYKEALLEIDKKWNNVDVWRLIKRESDALTASYYLSAMDMRFGPTGEVTSQPEDRQIYMLLFQRTLFMSLVITGLCILLGFPIAYLLATIPMRYAGLLMILVLLPFWTSLLVRTTSWIALLQSQGVINDLLVAVGLVSDDGRLQLIHNKTGTFIAMTHILLPFMILPLYSVMKTIPPSYMRAARSMGATQWWAFYKVYLPLTLSGIGAGTILVFILSIGFYITPELVGGTNGTLISNFIANHISVTLNWGLAAALGTMLLALVLVLYLLYDRIVGVDNMKMG
jgi:putative spermidine/putrescine transport system permease protein